MGRAKKLKQLRKAVRQLPKDYEQRIIGSKIKGEELIEKRSMTKLPNGEEIKADVIYLEKVTQINQVDHYRKMKKFVRPGQSNHEAGQHYLNMVIYKDHLRKKQQEEQKAAVNE